MIGRTPLARTPPSSSSPVSHRTRSATTAHLDAAAHYSRLGLGLDAAPVLSPRLPPQPLHSMNFDSASRGLDSEEAQGSSPSLQLLREEMARMRQDMARMYEHLAHQQFAASAHPAAPPSAPSSSSSSKSFTLVQAFHSCLNGTPGQLPSIARHSDTGSRVITLDDGIRNHDVRFRVDQPIIKFLAEAKYGRARGGLQVAHLLLVPRPERLDPSVAQAPEVQLPLGDGQHLSMAIVESKGASKDQPKSFPLTGLLDLSRRIKALGLPLSWSRCRLGPALGPPPPPGLGCSRYGSQAGHLGGGL